MRRIGTFVGSDHGATVVEFALVAPVLILVLIGCLDFARALNAYVTVANASREGARYASLHPTAAPAAIRDYVESRVVPLSTDPAVLFVGVSPYAPTGDPRWSAAAPRPGNATVTVRYRWDAATAVVGMFFSAAGGSSTFEVSSTMESIQ